MEMTDKEIRKNYQEAKYPKRQIKILAQLNACSKGRIERILFGQEITRTKSTSGAGREPILIDVDEATKMYNDGIPLTKIAKHFGVSTPSLSQILAEEGILKRE